jgi:hypothetical protein
MIEAVIMTLIYICLIALVVYLAFWVLSQIGVGLPPQAIKIIWVVVALICLLLILRVLLPPLHLVETSLTLVT